jgi:hypothetical protein
MARPTGVTILAVLAAIGGVFGILGGLALLGIGTFFASAGLGGLAFVFGLIALAVGIAELAFAYGAWTLKPWGWTLGIVLAAVSIVLYVVEVVLGYADITGVIISIVISAVIIYYLNMPDIRRAFGAPEKGWPFMGG